MSHWYYFPLTLKLFLTFIKFSSFLQEYILPDLPITAANSVSAHVDLNQQVLDQFRLEGDIQEVLVETSSFDHSAVMNLRCRKILLYPYVYPSFSWTNTKLFFNTIIANFSSGHHEEFDFESMITETHGRAVQETTKSNNVVDEDDEDFILVISSA